MRNLPLTLITAALVLVSATGPAAADRDPKNYPGVACLAPDSDISRNPNNGRAMNTTYSDTTFICPAVKDGAGIVRALVFVLDRHPNRAVECTLRSGRPQGAAQWFATKSSGQTFVSNDAHMLDFPALQSVARGFYWITCAVPRASLGPTGGPSGIAMYQIVEGP